MNPENRHSLVLGPPGSGKTTRLVDLFNTLTSRPDGGSAPQGEPDVFILTYSKDSYRQLIDAVVPKNSAHLGPLPVIQYSQIAREVIAASGRSVPVVLDELGEQLLLDKVLNDLRVPMKSDLRTICQSDRFRRDVLDVFHALMQNGVDAAALERVFEARVAGVVFDDILALYKAYCGGLDKAGFATHKNISRIAAECCGSGPPDHPVARARALLIDDFQDIDSGQFELLKAVAPPGGEVSVRVFGDPLGSAFGRRGTQHRFLMEDYPAAYDPDIVMLKAVSPHTDALAVTLKELLEEILGEAAGDFLPVMQNICGVETERCDAIFQIETARDEMDEVAAVMSRVSHLVSSGERSPGEIAILTNEKSRYEPLLSAVAAQRGIRLDTGSDEQTVFGDFLHALLILFDSPEDPVALRALLTSPMGPYLDAFVRDAPPGGDDSADRLKAFLKKLSSGARAGETSRWMEHVVDGCLRAVCNAYQKDFSDESVFAELCRLLESWSAYVNTVERVKAKPGVREFVRVSDLFSMAARSPGVSPDTVGVYSCREVKGRYFPVVFVVGCSELLFPSASRRENILPVAAIKNAFDNGAPNHTVAFYSNRTRSQQLSEEYHQLYTALIRSTGELRVTAPEMFAGADHPAPAAILKETVPPSFYAVTEEGSKIPPQVRFASGWIGEADFAGVSGDIESLSPAGAQWRAPRPKTVPVEVERFPLSKSSIESYVNCPRQFFYRKILRIRDDQSLPARVGSLVHEVMADLGEDYPSKKELQQSATPEVVDRAIDKVIKKDGTIDQSSLFGRSLKYHIGRIVGKFLEVDRENSVGYAIDGTESKFEFAYTKSDFVGVVDRVEKTTEGGSVIVDFKTGFPKNVGKTGKNLRKRVLVALEDREKANWQVPLYAWGFKSESGCLPRAFKYVMATSADPPVEVTTFFGIKEDDVLPDAGAGKRVSYLLEHELKEIMNEAGAVADEMFSNKETYERAEDVGVCRFCEFKGLCMREGHES